MGACAPGVHGVKGGFGGCDCGVVAGGVEEVEMSVRYVTGQGEDGVCCGV